MSKSIYEKYADGAQPEVLAKRITFEEAVDAIRRRKALLSKQEAYLDFAKSYVEHAEEICAEMFGLSFDEVRDLVEEKPYWISAAGALDEYLSKSNEQTEEERCCWGSIYVPFGWQGLCAEVGSGTLPHYRLANEAIAVLEDRLRTAPGIYDVSVEFLGDWAIGCILSFTFYSRMDATDIERVLPAILYGLKVNFHYEKD